MRSDRRNISVLCASALLVITAWAGAGHAQELTDARRIAIAKELNANAVFVSVGRAVGSGFVAEGSGFIVTNAHVVRDYRRAPVEIEYGDGGRAIGTVLAYHPEHDLAVVRPSGMIKVKGLPLGDSSRVQVGQSVLAYGSPFGLQGTLTQGIVSALRDLPVRRQTIRGLIQTDAPINSGNSGGPLVNARGEVIGVNTMIVSKSGGSDGIGFAVPSNLIRHLIELTRSQLRAQRGDSDGNTAQPAVGNGGWLGVMVTDYRFGTFRGVRIDRVVAGGPAARAGLRGLRDEPPSVFSYMGPSWSGHIIVAVDGAPVQSALEFIEALDGKRPGQTVRLRYEVGPGAARGELGVRLGSRPAP